MCYEDEVVSFSMHMRMWKRFSKVQLHVAVFKAM